jgi:hypothetical protein
MSYYENLPVYKKALDLAEYFDKVVCHFAKRHKYTIGTRLFDLSCEVLVLIAIANEKTERKEHLMQVLLALKKIKVLLHLCKQINAFHNFNSFEVAVKLVVEVSKQCEGWLRSSQSPLGSKSKGAC